MRKAENDGNSTGGLSLFDALLRDSIVRSPDGTQKGIAETFGVNAQTVSRWVKGVTNPLANDTAESKRLAEGLGRSVKELRTLGAISVQEACEHELAGVKAEQTASEDSILHAKLLDLISKKGTEIPSAAFIIFLTGNIESKQKIISILEGEETKIPEAITTENLQFALDVMKTGE